MLAWLVGAAVFLLGFAGEVRSGLNGDSAWMLHVARRVSEGARLYVDVVEVNPPLIVWLNLPVVWIARVTGWDDVDLYRGLVWAASFLVLWLVDRSLRRLEPRLPDWRRRALLLGALVLLVGMPGPYFGQREHVVLILTLPWLVLSASRNGGAAIPTLEAVGVGALAAVGIALKPHYLLLGAAVILWPRVSGERAARRVSPETVALLAVTGLYGAFWAWLAPEYVSFVGKWSGVYWNYLRRPLGTILVGDILPLTVLASLLFWPAARRLTAHGRLADQLGVATSVFLLALLLQHKGFGYHYYPALGTGLLLTLLGVLGGGAWASGPPLRRAARGAGLLVLLPALALFIGTALARTGGSARKGVAASGSREIAGYLQGREPRGDIVVYSPWMEDSFPMVLEQRVGWASRYPFMWFLPALHSEALAGSGPVSCRGTALPPAERELIGTVAEDLRLNRPDLVFIRNPAPEGLLRIPILECFLQSGDFRREFRAYRAVLDLEHFRVYQRSDI